MSNKVDLFPALSGLASRYQSSSAAANEYLAGLWEATLAQDLSWRVIRAVSASSESDSTSLEAHSPPSWTWASLPIRTGIEYVTAELGAAPCLDFVGSSTGDLLIENIGSDDISMGSAINTIRVCGRLRPFWHDDAEFCAWSDIVTPSPPDTPKTARLRKKPVFTFGRTPERHVFSAEADTGMVVSYEARRQETAGQLDYISAVKRIQQGKVRLYALQLTEEALLLVEEVGEKKFRRLGAAHNYRAGFFEGIEVLEIELV
jgi:hypothetical protein